MYIALDIGGTNTRVAAFKNGEIIEVLRTTTKKNDFHEAMKEISEMVAKLKTEEIKGIGISAPGPANFETGVMGLTPNLPDWSGKNVKEELAKLTNVKNISMQNDANLMALAHHFYFKNNGQTTQFFTVSTGLGAGVVINDKVYTGNQGLAMEVAYAPVAWKRETGKDLSEGALELFTSGSGIAFRAKTDTKTVFEEYKTNPEYKTIIEDAIETLANMIAITCAMIDPSLIVFDGPLARHQKWYIDKAIELAGKRMVPGQLENIKIKFAELGDDAGLYGAYNLISK